MVLTEKGSVTRSSFFVLTTSLQRKAHLCLVSSTTQHSPLSFHSQWHLTWHKIMYLLSVSAILNLQHTSPFPNSVLSSFLILASLNHKAPHFKEKSEAAKWKFPYLPVLFSQHPNTATVVSTHHHENALPRFPTAASRIPEDSSCCPGGPCLHWFEPIMPTCCPSGRE